MSRPVLIALALLAAAAGLHAETVPFDDPAWRIEGDAILHLEYQGRQALYLQNGFAVLPEVTLENGVVEFDMAFSAERGFSGAVWRLQGPGEYEHFYVRPHQSGMPDANQYTPVFGGVSGWQLYHGDGYSTPRHYRFNEWTHVRIVFWGDQAQVYIGDGPQPALEIPELKRAPAAGAVGVNAAFAPAYFSGFSYRELNERPFGPIERPAASDDPALVRGWQVSRAFPAARLEGVTEIVPADLGELGWRPLAAEPTGITNLARLHDSAAKGDTRIARLRIDAEAARVARLQFGYSDAVRVYLNGTLLYAGDNSYRSRDFRYLGTIGLFDELYLPLRAGRNEVWFAVTEAFGGWGILARLHDPSGLRLVD